jgi:polyhydroxybutyrate depolymerase
MHIHGLLDDRELYNGGCGSECDTGTEYTSVTDTISGWVRRDGCEGAPKRVFENEQAYCDLYDKCSQDTQVKLCVVTYGGHSWPGGKRSSNPMEPDAPSNAISATDEIWEFFKSVK